MTFVASRNDPSSNTNGHPHPNPHASPPPTPPTPTTPTPMTTTQTRTMTTVEPPAPPKGGPFHRRQLVDGGGDGQGAGSRWNTRGTPGAGSGGWWWSFPGGRGCVNGRGRIPSRGALPVTGKPGLRPGRDSRAGWVIGTGTPLWGVTHWRNARQAHGDGRSRVCGMRGNARMIRADHAYP